MENFQNHREPQSASKKNRESHLQNKCARPASEASNTYSYDQHLIAGVGSALGQLGEILFFNMRLYPCVGDMVRGAFVHIITWAEKMGCSEYSDEFLSMTFPSGELPTPDYLTSTLDLYRRLNEEIWPREQIFEPQTPENLEWRKLGKAMHLFYEAIKRLYWLCGGEDWRAHSAMLKQFERVFSDVMKRAQAGEPIAIEVMRTKWGILL